MWGPLVARVASDGEHGCDVICILGQRAEDGASKCELWSRMLLIRTILSRAYGKSATDLIL